MRTCLFCVLLWLSTPVPAENGDIEQLKNAAVERGLAESPAWRALGQYRRHGARWLSEVDDPDFFLAAGGATDPRAELLATLEAFASGGGDDPDADPRCRFPARFHWLSEALTVAHVHLPPARECPAFEKWYQDLDPAGVSLIFPAAYLNNPSSMFGHTFLRIDGKDQDEQSRLLAYSINYGANVPDGEGQFATVFKGLTGGYTGTLSGAPYYDKVIEYNDIEARDIWEYRLNLTAGETRQLLRHVWELRGIEFDYYFFDENCSYRLLTLLEAARPGANLSAEFGTHAIPADTVRVLEREGLLADGVYRPSAVSRLRHRIGRLDRQYRPLAHELALGRRGPDELADGIDPRTQAEILELAYQYSRYQARRDPADRKEYAARSFELLRRRSELPAFEVPPPAPPVRPDRGHDTARMNLAAGRIEGTGFASLRLRPAFHDLLDASEGYVEGSEINFFDMEVRRYDEPVGAEGDRWQLHALDLVGIVSLTPRTRFFRPHSWTIRAGWQRALELEGETARFVFDGGRGVAYAAGRHVTVYGLAGLRVRADADLGADYEAALSADAGLLATLGRATLRLRHRRYQYDGANPSDGGVSGAELNWPLGRNNALRLEYERADLRAREIDTARLGWNWYF